MQEENPIMTQYLQRNTIPSLGLLALRLSMGSAFVLHGLMKVPAATHWMGDAVPGVFQAMAAYSELLGGAALFLGFLTPLASLALIGVMLGALFLHHLPNGDAFVSMGKSSFELPLTYLAGAVLFLLNSPGKFSIDYLLARFLPGNRENTATGNVHLHA
jgi:putative oxidoreductase